MHDDGKPKDHRDPASTMSDVLALPEHLRALVTWMMRSDTCSLEDIASRLGCGMDDARQTIEELMERGLVQSAGNDRYRSRPATRSRRRVPPRLWNALESLDDE